MKKKFKGTVKWCVGIDKNWGTTIYNVKWISTGDREGYEISWRNRATGERESYIYTLTEIRSAYNNGSIKIITNETV